MEEMVIGNYYVRELKSQGLSRVLESPRMMAELGMERNARARSLSLQFGG